jgi:uncharacterized protein YndB with AHSA1/START domain
VAERPPPYEELTIAITRVFDAPRDRVWREWTEPEAFADWFGGPQSEVPLSSVEMDVQAGGRWRLTMFAARGEIQWKGQYLEVTEPERLVFTITDVPDEDQAHVITVVLNDLGDGRTEMQFEQRGRMGPAQQKAAGEGWQGFFDRIAERLAGA